MQEPTESAREGGLGLERVAGGQGELGEPREVYDLVAVRIFKINFSSGRVLIFIGSLFESYVLTALLS